MNASPQFQAALKALHPGVKRDIKRAITNLLAGNKRDTKALRDDLQGFYRLRVGKYRVIYSTDRKTGEYEFHFLQERSTVYEAFTVLSIKREETAKPFESKGAGKKRTS